MHSERMQSCTDPVSQDWFFCVQKEAGKWQFPNKYWYSTSAAYQVLFAAQNLHQRKQVTNSLQCQKQLQTAKTMFILKPHSPSRRTVFGKKQEIGLIPLEYIRLQPCRVRPARLQRT